MKYAEAIAALKDSGIEGIGEILTAITQKAQDLERYKQQRDELDSVLNAALQGFGSESDGLDKRLKVLSTELETIRGNLTTTEQAKAEAEGKLIAYQRKELVETASRKAGANPETFSRLLGAEDKVSVEGDRVLVNGLAFKEWSESEGIKPFLPVLIPQNSQTALQTEASPKRTGLPEGSPKGEKPDPVKSYLNKRYSIPEHLKRG